MLCCSRIWLRRWVRPRSRSSTIYVPLLRWSSSSCAMATTCWRWMPSVTAMWVTCIHHTHPRVTTPENTLFFCTRCHDEIILRGIFIMRLYNVSMLSWRLGNTCFSVSQVNLKEQGQLVRQDEFTIWYGRKKCQRHVFLLEDLVLFSKPKRIEGGLDVYIYKHSFKVNHNCSTCYNFAI